MRHVINTRTHSRTNLGRCRMARVCWRSDTPLALRAHGVSLHQRTRAVLHWPKCILSWVLIYIQSSPVGKQPCYPAGTADSASKSAKCQRSAQIQDQCECGRIGNFEQNAWTPPGVGNHNVDPSLYSVPICYNRYSVLDVEEASDDYPAADMHVKNSYSQSNCRTDNKCINQYEYGNTLSISNTASGDNSSIQMTESCSEFDCIEPRYCATQAPKGTCRHLR